MGQVSGGGASPCAAPGILVNYGCGGVVTLSARPVASNSTYDWDLGNGSTATGPGPITTSYSGAGPYTVTLTKITTSGLLGCRSSTTETITPTQGGGCCPSGIAAGNLLGAAGTTTTLPPGTYSGSYRVLGDLLLTNGSYTLSSATFFIDGVASKTLVNGSYQRTVAGSTITVGANATLTLDNSTLTAAGSGPGCPMWRGVVLNDGGQPSAATYQLVVQNNSVISHALCAVKAEGDVTAYRLDHSTFAHNLTHVYDKASHASSIVSVIANCTFASDPAKMHLPYDQTSATDLSYTYQALLLAPIDRATNSTYVLDVHDNTIGQAVYGIVNNNFDSAGVQIHDNQLSDIFATGIWTTDNIATKKVVSGNRICLDTSLGTSAEQVNPQATKYGFFSEAPSHNYSNSFLQNYVRWCGGPQPSKSLTGMYLSGVAEVSGNRLANLTEGIRTAAQNGALFDNLILDSDKGIVVEDGGGYSYQTTIGCNTFVTGSAARTQYAIEVQPGAYLYDQGSASSPAANRFDGTIVEAVHNDGAQPFNYWATSSPQEALVATNSSAGITPVYVRMAATPSAGWTNYCSGQGATKGNGVNARGAVLSAASLAALADSVRLRRVPPARRRAYLYQVLDSYQTTGQLATLEAWWATLLLPNAEDYRTTGLALLRAYDAQPAPAAAQRVLALLQPQALLNAEVAAALQYRTVRQHLPLTTPRLAAADSILLRTLAWSGTSLAERAGQWLRYFHPRLPLPALKAHIAHTTSRAALAKAGATGAMLGVAYPNPTQDEATMSYQLPKATVTAEISFTDLLTGRVQLTLPLKASRNAEAQTVQVPHLPAGQYMYRLLVNGQPVAIPQRLVVR
jgi:hypothetical protein